MKCNFYIKAKTGIFGQERIKLIILFTVEQRGASLHCFN